LKDAGRKSHQRMHPYILESLTFSSRGLRLCFKRFWHWRGRSGVKIRCGFAHKRLILLF
jgi:hypothetical protein